MNQKEITLLMSYVLNNKDRLEDDVRQLQSNVRFRRIDSADSMELTKSLIYLEAFNEITTHILCLLSLYPDDKKTGE
ncbi:MAG: hypothetical protein K2O29_00850 [Ruminococcus sp.]|nr:hypothetical protein [Ruminococcus sp.]MDE6849159.1 hypothetical protein [Ruminococcus sp.]MDE7136998.1 hypothetical protein [Ruminococcus sp.]